MIRIGVVEDRKDPLKLGRCRVRIIGLMTDNKSILPTEDLPWAIPQQSITSAAMSGIGHSPVGPVEGTWVTVDFLDDEFQYPIMTGTIAGVPGLKTNVNSTDKFTDIFSQEDIPEVPTAPEEKAEVKTGSGGTLVDSSGTAVITTSGGTYIGPLSKDEVNKIKEVIASYESAGSGGYKAINSLGYLGKYQFGSPALQDLGYVKKGTSNSSKILKNDNVWTGKNSISSRQSFLDSEKVQEEVMDIYMEISYKRMLSLGLIDKSAPKEKVAGLLCVNHLKGLGKGGVKDFLNGIDVPDDYGTRPSKYYNAGYNAIAGKTTVEVPTQDNINKESVDKNSAPTKSNKKYDTTGTQQKVPQQGFADPSGKYPLKDSINEPDTPRLTRGTKLDKTIVGEKEINRDKNISIANSGITWDQPEIPYNAVYPFNHVYQSESGHVMEFDDTPGYERINIHHTAGTFEEIDSFGNKTEKISGIRTIIVDKDELVYIKGSGHVSIDGDISVKVDKSCHIEINGNANFKVSGNTNYEVGGDFNVKASGNINLDGALMFMNSGSASGVDQFSPEITRPIKPSRKDVTDMLMEDVPKPVDVTAPPTKIEKKDDTVDLKVIPVSGDCNFSSVSYDLRLSTNYTLRQLCQGQPTFHSFPFKVGQHGLSDKELACNLKQLAINVIEPLRERFGHLGFSFTNTFREAGNKISKSNRISQHELGQAGDFVFSSFNRNKNKYFDIAKEIKNIVPFDQLLLESRSSGSVWIHISYKSTGNRNQILTLHNDKTVGSGLILVT